ncbi:MAG: hypothetical protein FNT15_04505 [Sulfurovum sp.]|nr:MAG: hypothetical protein FNT15_04505 [Sulfurovum sp.]
MTQLVIDIKDDYLYKFITLLDMLPKDKIILKKDFLSEEINKRIERIKNEMFVSHDDVWNNIEKRIEA